MKTKAIFLIGTAFGIFLILTFAFQFRKKDTEKKLSEKSTPKSQVMPDNSTVKTSMKIDTLLPDTTIAKQKRVQELSKEFGKIKDNSASKLVIEENQTKELEKQDTKLGKLVQSAPFVQPIVNSEITPKSLSYPDTLKIIAMPEKKSFIQKMNPFKRKKRTTNGSN